MSVQVNRASQQELGNNYSVQETIPSLGLDPGVEETPAQKARLPFKKPTEGLGREGCSTEAPAPALPATYLKQPWQRRM